MPALRKSYGGLAVRWMERWLIHAEGDLFGSPYRLLPWQKRVLWRWYEVHPDHPDPKTADFEWWYQEGLIGRVRGDVKSEFLAGICVLEFAGPAVFRRTSPVIHLAAAALDQANEVFGQAAIMCGGPGDIHPEAPLCGLFNVYDTEIQYRDGRPGRIERVPANAGTIEGTKTTLFGADEVHEWHGRAARVHTVLTLALEKRANARSMSLSTAGANPGSIPARDTDSLLWRLYARGLQSENDPTSRLLFEWAAAPEHLDWNDPEQLREALRIAGGGELDGTADQVWSVESRARTVETRKVPLHEAKRYLGNLWVPSDHDSWLEDKPGAWAANESPDAAIPVRAPVAVGVDMAIKSDSVGVTVVHRLDDGRKVWKTRVFVADPDTKKIDLLAVAAHIKALALVYRVTAIAYDPKFFEWPAQELEQEGFLVIEFPQSRERMVPACRHAYLEIMAGRIIHDGDVVLANHVNNGKWRETDMGRTLGKKGVGHIDALIAGIIATAVLDEPSEDEGEVHIY